MANLVTALAAAGADLSDVLKTTVCVSALGYRDQLVEIEAVAIAGGSDEPDEPGRPA